MHDKLNELDQYHGEPQVSIALVRSEVARILAEAGGIADVEHDMLSMTPPKTTDDFIAHQLAAAKNHGTVEALNLAGSLIDTWLEGQRATDT